MRRTLSQYPAVAVVLAVFAAYFPASHAGFIWDDEAHVTGPGLRSLHGLWRIWFEPGATQQYYPVLHSSFWLEHQLFGEAPIGYHVLNILLHATAACLFALVLRRLSIPGAWWAAAIFALHPVCVESVAWISEQKNTLSLVFYLTAALAYLRFDHERKPRWYAVSSCLFVLALLSKSVTATLPAALLVLIWWRRGGLNWRRDVLPIVPWLALGAASGLFTAWIERHLVGAQGTAFDLSAFQRCELAGRVVWFYLFKLVWPANLIFVYPHWDMAARGLWGLLAPVALAATLAALWAMRRRTRSPLAAALFFTGSLFPVLGFFNVYPFAFSYVADHFQYLASLGIIALIAASWSSWKHGSSIVLAGVVCALGILTWRQCRMYQDAQTLYRTTLDRNPGCWIACNNLGLILERTAHPEEALAQFRHAAELRPDDADTLGNLGNALARAGQLGEAAQLLQRAIALKPDFPPALNNLGLVLARSGQMEQAIRLFGRALELRPDYPEAHSNLGNALGRAGRLEEAVSQFETALRLRPSYSSAHYNLAITLRRMGRSQEAASHFEAASRRSAEAQDEAWRPNR